MRHYGHNHYGRRYPLSDAQLDAWERRWGDHQRGWEGPPASVRLWLPVVISLLWQVPITILSIRGQVADGADISRVEIYGQIVIALLGPLVLIGARRFPGPVVAIVAAAAAIDLFIGPETRAAPYLALAFAIIGGIVRGARVWVWISVATAWVGSIAAALIIGFTWEPFRIAAITLGILITMGIGESIRTRRDRIATLQQARSERRQTEVQAERVRIARELHDVLAHSLSQINVQASVGLHLMREHPEKAEDALASIKETSKSALDEVRSVLGVLRAEGGADPSAPLVPEPDLSRLPGLAASVTSQGVAVTLSALPENAPRATQLAIYRIVQESLTNIVRHSGATSATVDVTVDDDGYVVTIADNGHGAQSDSSEGGRGLLGMRERAELLGGHLEARNRSTGGFAVTARIPLAVGSSAQ
jgi:signal transduction histidine kinase